MSAVVSGLVDLKLAISSQNSGNGHGRPAASGAGTAPVSATAWPQPLEDAAFHGLAGQFVHAVELYSEADPAALLIHLLSGSGCLIGARVHAAAGDAVHPARISAVVVGETAHGRKGSSAGPVRRMLRDADPTFSECIRNGGFSSGEGLIFQVRDPVKSWQQPKGTQPGQYAVTDPGEADKRLWVVDPEFAGALKMGQREGNILTPVIRMAWDDGDLSTMTKNSPTRATGAHIAIVGHVTRDEVRRYLTATEQASGYANRFLWVCARRARLLPDGASVPARVLASITVELQKVLDWSQTPRHLDRDRVTKDVWASVYGPLSEGRAGLLGAVTNRAEAQVLRLSVLYAALDRSALVRIEHLLAALAVWQYAEQSAAYVFGDALGDPLADELLSSLRSHGPMSRTQIVDLFKRHTGKDRIDGALTLLESRGLAALDKDTDTGGRPRAIWHAT
jgi:hypothetical protein